MGESGLAVVGDYVEGEPLGSLLRLGSVRRVVFPVPVALHVVLGLLDALGYVHERAHDLSVPADYVFGGVGPSTVLLAPMVVRACYSPAWPQLPRHRKRG